MEKPETSEEIKLSVVAQMCKDTFARKHPDDEQPTLQYVIDRPGTLKMWVYAKAYGYDALQRILDAAP